MQVSAKLTTKSNKPIEGVGSETNEEDKKSRSATGANVKLQETERAPTIPGKL